MTNPDAYTLAAQAAADRARAEAAQGQGTPGGPGLQSPMRKLSKIPGARWVLSAVLLAAGSALAVDYLNTPLRAWLQYHAPVPGAGGQSVAEIAAKESAKPQADIDTNITQPAQVDARVDALKQSDAEKQNRIIAGVSERPSDIRLASAAIYMYAMPNALRRHSEEYKLYVPFDTDTLRDGEHFIDTTPTAVTGTTVRPLLFQDGSRATIKQRSCDRNACSTTYWLLTQLGNGDEAIIRQQDFDTLKRSNQPEPRNVDTAVKITPPVIPDIGNFGIGDKSISLRSGDIYIYNRDTGEWLKSVWSNCTREKESGGAGNAAYECSSNGSTLAPGRYRVHGTAATGGVSPGA